MSKTKPKRIPVALLKGAYKKALEAYERNGGTSILRGWHEVNTANQAALLAFARYILKHQPK